MSMHEFEDLVEDTVRFLSSIPMWTGGLDLRSTFWDLYEFQSAWDTGFTHFRVLDLLVEQRFAYRFHLADHPEYILHRACFDQLKPDEYRIELPGTGAWDGGYYEGTHLYCDAGSPLWRRFVDSGRLRGADAHPPQPIDLYVIARDVARLADAFGDSALVARWYRILAAQAMATFPDGEGESLRANPALLELRTIVKRTGALNIEFDDGILNPKNFPPPEIAGTSLLGWWYQLG